jgi:hypothetical protein
MTASQIHAMAPPRAGPTSNLRAFLPGIPPSRGIVDAARLSEREEL